MINKTDLPADEIEEIGNVQWWKKHETMKETTMIKHITEIIKK